MTDTTPAPMIRLNKLVRASRERVFDAWVTPEDLGKWWLPGPGEALVEVEMDARVGGVFRVIMRAEGQTHTGRGEFTVMDRPSRLAFTWTWEETPDFGADSLVTVELHEAANPYDDGPATEVVLTHERLPSAAERSEHTGGWWNTLRALGYLVRGVDPREAMYGGK